jgi:hypothetical protein
MVLREASGPKNPTAITFGTECLNHVLADLQTFSESRFDLIVAVFRREVEGGADTVAIWLRGMHRLKRSHAGYSVI